MIVVTSADQMPAASIGALACVTPLMVRKTSAMPQTVPSSPSSGETTLISLSQHRPFSTR